MAETGANAPRPASTVVLLRDAVGGPRGVEVFLMRRHGASGFMAGATVFPGGKVDAEDACAGSGAGPNPLIALPFFVAALRELHEESHVLLARDGSGNLPEAAAVAALDARLDELRTGHRLACADWHRCVADAGFDPALDLLVPFAHWVTPQVEPRRFDTYFFAAACPPGQDATLDRHESTDAFWMTPAAALAAHASGGPIALPPPTQHTLMRLEAMRMEGCETTQQTLVRLAAEGIGPRIEPHFIADSADGPVILMPWDVQHPDARGTTRLDRFVLQDGRFSRRQTA